MRADLHIHTTASDGRLTPKEVVEQARQQGLKYIAITDHDTIDGLLELQTNAEAAEPWVIPGIEFSVDLPKHEVHILGYYIDLYHDELRQQLEFLSQDRVVRVRKMLAKLNILGYAVDYDLILEIAGSKSTVGRPHVAKALVARGYFASVPEVFDVLLARGGPAYVPHYKLSPQAVIKLIARAGGVPVLAHPGLIGNDMVVRNIIAAGVKGLEVYHPEHDNNMATYYLNLARKYKLKITGGSDYHGIPGRFPEKLGLFTVPGTLAQVLGV